VTEDCWATAVFCLNTYTVTPVASGGGKIMTVADTNKPSVLAAPMEVIADGVNNVVRFRIVPDPGYGILNVSGCDGKLSNADNTYTATVTRNCQVVAAFTNAKHKVTTYPSDAESASRHGGIWPDNSPGKEQEVIHGHTTQFTVTAATGYTAEVGGNCGGDVVNGTGTFIYTTPPINKDCYVAATFNRLGDIMATSLVKGGGGDVIPNTAQSVAAGSTMSYTAIPIKGYVTHRVGGTCPMGSWNGNTWTTGAINASCTTEFSFFCDLCIPSYGGWRSVVLPK
jgi:hypothetical protein